MKRKERVMMKEILLTWTTETESERERGGGGAGGENVIEMSNNGRWETHRTNGQIEWYKCYTSSQKK